MEFWDKNVGINKFSNILFGLHVEWRSLSHFTAYTKPHGGEE
jgi:hypothetical protein